MAGGIFLCSKFCVFNWKCFKLDIFFIDYMNMFNASECVCVRAFFKGWNVSWLMWTIFKTSFSWWRGRECFFGISRRRIPKCCNLKVKCRFLTGRTSLSWFCLSLTIPSVENQKNPLNSSEALLNRLGVIMYFSNHPFCCKLLQEINVSTGTILQNSVI